MRTIICENYDQMSKTAADLIRGTIQRKPDCVLGLATGSTPVGMYRELVRMHREEGLSFARVTTYNLDEYYPIRKDNDQSYDYFMHQNLWDHVDLAPDAVHVPNGETDDPAGEGKRYDRMLQDIGGVDIQVLGIGENGHIGFNEPDDALIAGTHMTALTESTIHANARFFASEKEVPTHAITMGMASILSARTILLLISGEKKRDAYRAMTDDLVTPHIPATFLKLHRDVIILCDKAAAGI